MFQELIDNITNVGVFTESLGEWATTLSINKVIIFIMMIFMIVGAIDKIRGNKLGYGEQFDEGFNAMGPLAAAMAGVVAAAPVHSLPGRLAPWSEGSSVSCGASADHLCRQAVF